jgi:phospho-N-acetylmuramoyl-pentapeptide-transferase
LLYWLLYQKLYPFFHPFRIFRYLTFRTAFASGTALLIALFIGPYVIQKLQEFQIGQYIREDGPQSHQKKSGTPTMGGVLIGIAILLPTVLWSDPSNPFVWVTVFSTAAFGAIGFADDYIKVVKRRNLGLTARAKLAYQALAASGVAIALVVLQQFRMFSTRLNVPFIKSWHPDLLWHSAMSFTNAQWLIYVSGNLVFADYLELAHLDRVSELTIFGGSMVGASIGFLWYNAHPAEIFMGDVGSLALGGAIGTVAIAIRQELLLPFIGGIFILEAVSVLLQVGSYKLRKKRIFKMAPLHHHFEQLGWSESKIIARFWIGSLIFALFALTTLKLR